MVLSILIPSIPERREQLLSLTGKLYRQILALQDTHPSLGSVELIIDDSKKFTDGGLSIGEKRNALLQRASGEYLCFLDDDDEPTPNYIEQLVRMCNEGNDIVTFRCLVKNDHYWSLIDMSLVNEVNEEVNPNSVIKRTPWHVCPVKRALIWHIPFTAVNHNEDWSWMAIVLTCIKTESHTDMILTQYNHSEAGSEADRIVRGNAEPEKQSTKVLISLAVNGRENYVDKSENLERSIAKEWVWDTRLYKAYPDYCTPNSVIPYKFKYDLIKQARSDGYKQIYWLDSSIRLANGPGFANLFPESGIIAFDNLGHPLWKYISDKAAANLNVSDSELKMIPQTWGGALGFDFTKDKACEIFEEICKHSMNGSFETNGSRRTGFVSHRHDQAVISVILWKHKIKLLPYGEIVSAEHAKSGEHGTNFKLVYGD